jgi:hypothetical protein
VNDALRYRRQQRRPTVAGRELVGTRDLATAYSLHRSTILDAMREAGLEPLGRCARGEYLWDREAATRVMARHAGLVLARRSNLPYAGEYGQVRLDAGPPNPPRHDLDPIMPVQRAAQQATQ